MVQRMEKDRLRKKDKEVDTFAGFGRSGREEEAWEQWLDFADQVIEEAFGGAPAQRRRRDVEAEDDEEE